MMNLRQVVEDVAPFLHRGLDRGEVVVGENHVCGTLGHVGAGDAHGDADVGLFERGRVVHTVAGHGHDMTARLERPDQPQFLLGRNTGEDCRAFDHVGQLIFAQFAQVASAHREAIRRAFETDGAGNGRRGEKMIAGDHLHPDARGAAVAHGFDRFRPRGIDHPLQPEESESLCDVPMLDLPLFARRQAAGEGEHAQAARGNLLGSAGHGGVVECDGFAAIVECCRATVEQTLDGPLLVDDVPGFAAAVQRRHELVLGLERDGIEPRQQLVDLGVREAGLFRHDDERRLGWIALHGPAFFLANELGVVAEQPSAQALGKRGPTARDRPADHRPRGFRHAVHSRCR